jgi:hypothetical protein
MTLKLFRAAWFLSMLAVLANLLYVYASLPEVINLGEDGVEPYSVGRAYSVGRETFFYAAMIFIGIGNLIVYLFSRNLTPSEDFRIWIHGLVITINIFFIVGMSFITLFNSAEKYDFERLRFIIYSSVGLVVLWAIGWPIYLLGKKLLSKQTV